jgi:FlaA1/EpsC-like NDP-sugar epimerase
MIFYVWLGSVALVTLGRWILQRLRGLMQSRGLGRSNVIVIGTGEIAQLVIQKIRGSPFLGYHIVGLVDGPHVPRRMFSLPVLGQTDDLPRLMDSLQVDEVIIATPEADDDEMVRLISLCQREGVSIKVFPDVFELMAAA